MTTNAKSELGYIVVGTVTSTGVGSFLFQALGTLVLGIIGALGSYLFVKLIKPKLDKYFDNLKQNKNDRSKTKKN